MTELVPVTPPAKEQLPFDEELRLAPYRSQAEHAEIWVNAAISRAEDPKRPEDTSRIRQERVTLLGTQIINAYEILVDGQGDIVNPEDGRKVAHRMTLLGRLALPEQEVELVDRARALSFADDLARLVWKDAYNEHKLFKANEATQQALEAKEAATRQAEIHSHDAAHDPLTGLPNRRGLKSAFVLLVNAVERGEYEGDIALLMGDLDGFKPVNDAFGHEAGDKILIQVAEYLDESTRRISVPGLREADVVVRVRAKNESEEDAQATSFRMGGDEFAVLALISAHSSSEEEVGLDPYQRAQERALKMASRLSEGLRAKTFRIPEGEVSGIGISIGVAIWKKGMPLNVLIHDADIAMYAAKRGTGQQV